MLLNLKSPFRFYLQYIHSNTIYLSMYLFKQVSMLVNQCTTNLNLNWLVSLLIKLPKYTTTTT